MTKRREFFIALLGALAFGATVRADMMPVSPSDAGLQRSPRACVATPQRAGDSLNPFDGSDLADLDLLPVASLPDLQGDVGSAGETQPVPILTDGQNSFSLCLYALLGLGLCRSAPLVKKLSFGYIPQWYHDSGPWQVGHSLAISPDCLCSAPVYCFVQPDCTAEDLIPQYRRETIISLWRKSQFTPAALASRGPPMSR